MTSSQIPDQMPDQTPDQRTESPSAVSNDSNFETSTPTPADSRFRLPLWAKITLLASVIALSSLGYLTAGRWKSGGSSGAQAELDPEELARRQPVDEFNLLDARGNITAFSSYKGQVVILSFWASWCTPCLIELPAFAELERQFHDQGLRVVPINMDEGDEGLTFSKDFWAKNDFPFPSFFDKSKRLAQKFEVDVLPSNFVIDRKGRLVFSSFGANDWTNAQTREFLEGLLLEGD